MASLLSITLRRKRDALFARQRLRQLTRLFRLPLGDQLSLPAHFFTVAWHGLQCHGHVTLEVEAAAGVVQFFLQLGTSGERELWLEKRLPADLPIAADDLPWAVQECIHLVPPRLWDEVCQENDALLQLLHELQQTQARLAQAETAKQASAA